MVWVQNQVAYKSFGSPYSHSLQNIFIASEWITWSIWSTQQASSWIFSSWRRKDCQNESI